MPESIREYAGRCTSGHGSAATSPLHQSGWETNASGRSGHDPDSLAECWASRPLQARLPKWRGYFKWQIEAKIEALQQEYVKVRSESAKPDR